VQDDFHDAVLKKPMLERGYAVLTSGATNMARTCNEVVGAEALMMLKEHVVERYGPIRFTIGEGCSGGGILPLDIAANYPGLLNGLLPGCSYPDYWTVGQMNLDCGLLIRAFDAADEDGSRWSAERDRAATTGLGDSQGCRDGAGRWQQLLRPDVPDSCVGQGVLASRPDFDTGWVYSTKTNPTGVRCTLQDYQETLFGRRADGKANRAYDNVGVQYGLRALQAGGITAAQFIDLNRRVGGYDIDGNWQPQRSVADPPAVTRAYRGGRVISAGALQDVAIISSREYVDDGHDGAPHEEGWHTRVYDYSLRDRLQRDTGSVDNQVIVTAHTYERAHEPTYDPLDRWLSAVERDTSNRSLAEKLRIDRPAYVVDTCFDHGNQIIAEHACDAVYPVNSLPRRVAGGPDTDDVIKCQLKPLDRGDYPTSLSDAEFDQLLAIFPDGVCDYVRPGVGQGSSVAWLSYAEGPDGTPLGPPPTSSPLP
jgi:hypothetical protein